MGERRAEKCIEVEKLKGLLRKLSKNNREIWRLILQLKELGFSDSQAIAIVDFVKVHPELYDKNVRFHDRLRKLCGQKLLKN